VDVAALAGAVEAEGIAGLPGSFERAWAERLREDFDALFAEARGHPDGTIGRGPQRFYFAVHPERLRGFVDLVTHPAVTGLSEQMLGPRYQVVEVAFDVPLPGAVHQPWHRDFAMPAETRAGGRLSSLAFNVPAVDVTAALGPFEIAPGTHRDPGDDFAHGMFPPRSAWPGYEGVSRQRSPRLGDMSVRTGLAIHRGTPNRGDGARPMLVLGVVAPEVDTSDAHELHVTREAWERWPEAVRGHLRCTVVEELRPIVQRHDIEGLMMGEA
jgi:Phytanoyl-CoA dioxygenase (PhyH)